MRASKGRSGEIGEPLLNGQLRQIATRNRFRNSCENSSRGCLPSAGPAGRVTDKSSPRGSKPTRSGANYRQSTGQNRPVSSNQSQVKALSLLGLPAEPLEKTDAHPGLLSGSVQSAAAGRLACRLFLLLDLCNRVSKICEDDARRSCCYHSPKTRFWNKSAHGHVHDSPHGAMKAKTHWLGEVLVNGDWLFGLL